MPHAPVSWPPYPVAGPGRYLPPEQSPAGWRYDVQQPCPRRRRGYTPWPAPTVPTHPPPVRPYNSPYAASPPRAYDRGNYLAYPSPGNGIHDGKSPPAAIE